MMRDLRIVFMGTPQFAVETLKQLISNDYNVVGVITAPDRPAGRGRKLQQSDVKKYALEQNLPILQPTNLKDVEFLSQLKSLRPNLQIVVAFRMLPKQVWKLPEYGTFNLHASLLPNYRGAAPIHWAIINGETITGVTTFFIDEKIDTGAIIMKDEVKIEDDETVGSLHDKLMQIGSKLVVKTVAKIEGGDVSTEIQSSEKKLKSAPKLNKENTRIDWSKDLDLIYNKIRGLNPFPTAWSVLNNAHEHLSVKIYKIRKEMINHNYDIAQVIEQDGTLKVAVKNGFIIIDEIQLPGKRKMDVKSLLNGFDLKADAKML